MAARYRREIFDWSEYMSEEQQRETEIFWATYATGPTPKELLYTKKRVRLSPSRLEIIKEEIDVYKIKRADERKAEEAEITKLTRNDLFVMIDESIIPNCLSPIRKAPLSKNGLKTSKCSKASESKSLRKDPTEKKARTNNNLNLTEKKSCKNDYSQKNAREFKGNHVAKMSTQRKTYENCYSKNEHLKATEHKPWKNNNKLSQTKLNHGKANSKSTKKGNGTVMVHDENDNEELLNDDDLFQVPNQISSLSPTSKPLKATRKSRKSKREGKYMPAFNTLGNKKESLPLRKSIKGISIRKS